MVYELESLNQFMVKERKKIVMKIKLKDNTELKVTDACTSTSIVAEFTSAEEIEIFRKKLTDENLLSFVYVNDDEESSVIGEYQNYTFGSVTYVEKENAFVATFSIRQLSDIEVRLAALEAGQNTQNDAIAEMSEIVYSE